MTTLIVFLGTQITEFAKSTARGVEQDLNQIKNAFVKRSYSKGIFISLTLLCPA